MSTEDEHSSPLCNISTSLADESTASAKELLNVRLPVGGLSTEVLCIVFGMLRDDARIPAAQDVGRDNSRAWTAITQVSRMWRSTSLGYAPLWNVLFLGRQVSNVSNSTMLSRSKAAPLTVRMYATNLDDADDWRASMSWQYVKRYHSDRVEALEIISDHLSEFLHSLALSLPWPNLRICQFTNTGRSLIVDFFRVFTPTRFPRLSVLLLDGIGVELYGPSPLRYTFPCFAQLSEFSIFTDSSVPLYHHGPGILDLLGTMPALRLLRLAGTNLSQDDIHPTETITFPSNLSNITFRHNDYYHQDDYLTFLRKLYHANASICFLVTATVALPFVIEFFGISRTPRNLSISVPDSQSMSISADRPHVRSRHTVNTLKVDFDSLTHIGAEDDDTNLIKLCSNIHGEEVDTVTLMTGATVGPFSDVLEGAWKVIHGPNISNIFAYGKAAIYSLLRVLTGHGKAACLYLHTQAFSLGRGESEAGDTDRLSSWAVEYLLIYARERKAKGISIRALTLCRGAVSEVDVLQLRDLICCVEFDDRYHLHT